MRRLRNADGDCTVITRSRALSTGPTDMLAPASGWGAGKLLALETGLRFSAAEVDASRALLSSFRSRKTSSLPAIHSESSDRGPYALESECAVRRRRTSALGPRIKGRIDRHELGYFG